MTASLPANTFEQALTTNRPLIGLWCNFAFLPTVEALTHAGFDWLLLDMEHTQSNLDTISFQLLALRGTPSACSMLERRT